MTGMGEAFWAALSNALGGLRVPAPGARQTCTPSLRVLYLAMSECAWGHVWAASGTLTSTEDGPSLSCGATSGLLISFPDDAIGERGELKGNAQLASAGAACQGSTFLCVLTTCQISNQSLSVFPYLHTVGGGGRLRRRVGVGGREETQAQSLKLLVYQPRRVPAGREESLPHTCGMVPWIPLPRPKGQGSPGPEPLPVPVRPILPISSS